MMHVNTEKNAAAYNGDRPVLVVAGSTRPGRLAPAIARWVMGCAPVDLGLRLELVDLADWPLPDDEPEVPAVAGAYRHAHTRAWSAKVAGAAGFVFVTPQYNWGYPAGLKNALDHLYREWNGKPAVIVSYGFHGGGRAAAQLRQVLEGLRMRPCPTMPALTLPEAMKDGASPDRAIEAFSSSAKSVGQAFVELSGMVALAP